MASAIGRWNPCTALRQRAGDFASNLYSRLPLFAQSIIARAGNNAGNVSVRQGAYIGSAVALLRVGGIILKETCDEETHSTIAICAAMKMGILFMESVGSHARARGLDGNVSACTLGLRTFFVATTQCLYGSKKLSLLFLVDISTYAIGKINCVQEKIKGSANAFSEYIVSTPGIQRSFKCALGSLGGLYLCGPLGAVAGGTLAGYLLSQKDHEE